MQYARPALITDPRRFGRGPARFDVVAAQAPLQAVSDEVKLFVTTFAAGFLFISCLIA